jgi:hypothetical protein
MCSLGNCLFSFSPKPFSRKNTYKIKKKKEVKSAGPDNTKSGIPQRTSERPNSAKNKSKKGNCI